MFSFFQYLTAKSNNQNLPIHLIWIGNSLRPQDIEKANKWKKLNPDSIVTVWTESESIEKFKSQLGESKNIVVGNLASLNIATSVKKLLTALTKQRDDKLVPNPAAASDIYRFYILEEFSGFYS